MSPLRGPPRLTNCFANEKKNQRQQRAFEDTIYKKNGSHSSFRLIRQHSIRLMAVESYEGAFFFTWWGRLKWPCNHPPGGRWLRPLVSARPNQSRTPPKCPSIGLHRVRLVLHGGHWTMAASFFAHRHRRLRIDESIAKPAITSPPDR